KGDEERMGTEDRRVLAVEMLHEDDVALRLGWKELGPRAPDSTCGIRSCAHDAPGHGKRVCIEELTGPILAVLRSRPLDRGAGEGLDDANRATRQDDRGDRRQLGAGREPLVRD